MIEGIASIIVEGVVEYPLPCSFQKLKDVESIIKIVDIDGRDQVRDFAEDMERMLGSKMKSVKVSTEVRGQRSLSGQVFFFRTFN